MKAISQREETLASVMKGDGMKRGFLIVTAGVLMVVAQAFGGNVDKGFWENHRYNQEETFVGFILYDMDVFKKGAILLRTVPEYSPTGKIGRPVQDVMIQSMDMVRLAELMNVEPPMIVEAFKDNLKYITTPVSVTVKCLKIKDKSDPVFRYLSLEKLEPPK
jgi:hypothetical protein